MFLFCNVKIESDVRWMSIRGSYPKHSMIFSIASRFVCPCRARHHASRVAESVEHGERRSKEGLKIPRKVWSNPIFKFERNSLVRLFLTAKKEDKCEIRNVHVNIIYSHLYHNVYLCMTWMTVSLVVMHLFVDESIFSNLSASIDFLGSKYNELTVLSDRNFCTFFEVIFSRW